MGVAQCLLFLYYYPVTKKPDKKWFMEQFERTAQGSMTGVVKLIKCPNGATLKPSGMSRILDGKQFMQFYHAQELSRILNVSIVEILIRAGIMTREDVHRWK